MFLGLQHIGKPAPLTARKSPLSLSLHLTDSYCVLGPGRVFWDRPGKNGKDSQRRAGAVLASRSVLSTSHSAPMECD